MPYLRAVSDVHANDLTLVQVFPYSKRLQSCAPGNIRVAVARWPWWRCTVADGWSLDSGEDGEAGEASQMESGTGPVKN